MFFQVCDSKKIEEFLKYLLTSLIHYTILYRHDCGDEWPTSPGSAVAAVQFNQGVDMFNEDIYAQCKEY